MGKVICHDGEAKGDLLITEVEVRKLLETDENQVTPQMYA